MCDLYRCPYTLGFALHDLRLSSVSLSLLSPGTHARTFPERSFDTLHGCRGGAAEEALVYASFGSGRLLFDFLLLRDMLAEGRRLRRVCLIDELYDVCEDERQVGRYEDHQVYGLLLLHSGQVGGLSTFYNLTRSHSSLPGRTGFD